MSLFEPHQQFDIRGLSFDNFVDFLFEHEVPPDTDWNGRRSKAWYRTADVEFEPGQLVKHYTRLFTEPSFLLTRYSQDKLEQGFWAMIGSLDCNVEAAIGSETVEFQERAICVRSMYFLFGKLFVVEPLETASSMWWDALAYDWDCGNRDRANGGEDLLMQDVMFETLLRILKLPDVRCQSAALHGLGHLHHPDTAKAVRNYLTENPQLDAEIKNYARRAAKFDVL